MPISGIIPQLRTTNLAESIRFYTTKLGLTLEFQYEDFYAGLRAGSQLLHLKLVDDKDPSIQFVDDGEQFHLYLETPDLADTASALKQKGVPLVQDIHETPWGTKELVIRDDQGHTLYFGEKRQAAGQVTTEFLQAFADAWNGHDAEALMTFMTDDCVFDASAGADVWGTRSAGQEAVRASYAEVWAMFPDAQWGNAHHIVCGDRGVSEWTFTGTRSDGTRVEVHGCDLFSFRDGRIAVKNSYRKNRPPLAKPGN